MLEFFNWNRKPKYVSSNADPSDRINYNGEQVTGLNQYSVWELIAKLHNVNNDYKYRYAEYQTMTEDVIIQSALELYADDSTQIDTKTSQIVSITANDATLQNDLNGFLKSINVESRVWNWAYNVAQYGDMFLKLYIDRENGNEVTVDDNTDPSLIMDLYERGVRVAYAEEDISEYRDRKRSTNPQGLDLILSSPNSFVHFMINKTSKYDTLEIPIDDQKDENGDYLVRKFTVMRGVSMLEGVRSIFRILQLLEDSLLAARIAKAEFVRVFNIEVGDSTPEQTTQVVNTVKNLFDSKATFDINTGRYVSAKTYRPIGDPIFNPTRNGKGSLTHENIGGDFQVKDIADIDYFRNKLFAGLKIPKALLGYEETLPGGLGDNTLTRLDIRYSRSVKRVQNALVVGITDLCRIWLDAHGRDSNADFQVILQAPSTAEELGRITEFDMKMTTISNITQNIANTYGEYVNVPKIYKILFDKYINYPELREELDLELGKAVDKYEAHLKEVEEQKKQSNSEDQDDNSSPTGGLNIQPANASRTQLNDIHPDLTPKSSSDGESSSSSRSNSSPSSKSSHQTEVSFKAY